MRKKHQEHNENVVSSDTSLSLRGSVTIIVCPRSQMFQPDPKAFSFEASHPFLSQYFTLSFSYTVLRHRTCCTSPSLPNSRAWSYFEGSERIRLKRFYTRIPPGLVTTTTTSSATEAMGTTISKAATTPTVTRNTWTTKMTSKLRN